MRTLTKKLSTNPHSDLVKQCRELIQIVGFEAKWGGGLGMKAGMPDIIASIPVAYPHVVSPYFLAVEVKTGKGKLSAAQEEVKAQMVAKGAIDYLVVRKIEELAEKLEQLTGRRLEIE